MDVVTHGLAGALVARAVTTRSGWPTVAVAIAGALAPDVDVVARLWDPMAAITVHRTMTHSFVGGLLLAAGVAGILRLWARDLSFQSLAGLAYLGVLSHIGLDLLNPFGTAVLWPLTSKRFGLGWLYVIDPVVFGLIVAGLLVTSWSTARRAAVPRGALALLVGYALVAGALGRVAEARWEELLAGQGVTATRRAVVPTFPGPWRWLGVAEGPEALYRARFLVGRPSDEPLAIFPRGPMDGMAGLDQRQEVRAFRGFARFPWVTVTTDGDLRQIEYRDLAFEDHPFGGPMALRLTVDQWGAVRAVELGHKL